MSALTPGKWVVFEDPFFPNRYGIHSGDGTDWIASVQFNGTAVRERQLANIHAMAAAPDLLKALKETTAALKAAWDSRILPADAISGEIVRQNIAAIAKAEVEMAVSFGEQKV